MRVHSIGLEIKDIEEYLNTKGGPFNLNSKDKELAVALILARFHKKQLGEECIIGIPARRERTYKNGFDNGFEKFEEYINYCIEEDSPIDISLVPKKELKNDGRIKPKGFVFQLKRFTPQDSGLSIAKYLNEIIPKKYSPVEHCVLVLIIGSEAESAMLDLGIVRDNFKPQTYPFMRVMFVSAGDDKVIIGEFWPNFGRQEYSIQEWFDDN
jgi:hypothetical protein